jgi:hypothetical protein
MQHPEIFRRMEAYGLDMTPYWSFWDGELKGYLDDMLIEIDETRWGHDPHAAYPHVPQLYTWFFFQNVSAAYLAEYRLRNPAAHQAAQAAYEATKAIGFGDPASQRRSFELLKDHWARYCANHLPRPFALTLAANISEGTVSPLIDIEKKRPAEEIMALFRKEGFRG